MASRILTRPLAATSIAASSPTVSRLAMGSSSSPAPTRPITENLASRARDPNTLASVRREPGPSAVSVANNAPAAQQKKASEASKYNDDDKPYVPLDEETEGALDEAVDEYKADNAESLWEGEDVPFAASHIAGGCLNTVGFACTQFGWEPVVSSVYLHAPATRRAIPVDFGAETESPTLNSAMGKTSSMLARQADINAQKLAAGSLVRRARLGDQNAMATLAETRTQAANGNPVAQSALACVRQYIEENPAGNTFHGEFDAAKKQPKMWAHVWLANGPLLSNARIREFASSFGEDTPEKQAFLQGLILFHDSDRLEVIGRRFDDLQRKIIDIGQMFGKARALQHVRSPQLRISDYFPVVGWELGE